MRLALRGTPSAYGRRSLRAARPVVARLLVLALLTGTFALPFIGLSRPPVAFAAAPQTQFADSGSHWASPAISILAAKRVVSGFPDGLFRPEATLTRAQFAKLMVAGLEGDAVANTLQAAQAVFTDLRGHWARGWAAAGLELGLMRGVSANLFAPDRGVSRAEVATVLVRAIGWETDAASLGQGPAEGYLSRYADATAVPGWAATYLALAAQRGLLRGYDDGSLRPLAMVTRAEACVLVSRALDRLGLLYDLGGRLADLRSDGSAVVRRLWGRADLDSELVLPTVAQTVWLRNGVAVEPAELAVGDTVAVVLGGRLDGPDGRAPALCVAALSWDVLGEVAAVDAAAGRVSLHGPAGPLVAHVSASTMVVRHGERAALSAIQPGDRAYVLFDALTGFAQVVDAVHVVKAGQVAAVRADGGSTVVELLSGTTGDDGDTAPGAQAAILPAAAAVFVNGLPAPALRIEPGMSIVLALPDGAGTSFGYAEAWAPEIATTKADRLDAVATDTAATPAASGTSATPASPLSMSVGQMGRLVSTPPPEQHQPLVLPLSGAPHDGSTGATGDDEVFTAQEGLAVASAAVGVSVRETGAPQAWLDHGVDGTGVTIAVVDTGVDPGHSILQLTTGRARKIVDWADFSGEGWVDTVFTSRSFAGYITTRLGRVRLTYFASRSGTYRSGVIDEAALPGEPGIAVDLNGDGDTTDSFVVVLIDVAIPGQYDTVFVDTDGDRDLRDETPLSPLKIGGVWTTFKGGRSDAGRGFAVAQIDRLGSRVVLGFDGNGHGTHVAGLVAGFDAARGLTAAAGMAPGARLMVVKALHADGSGTWESIRSGVEYAAANGADIAVLAIEGLTGTSVEDEYAAIATIAADAGMLVFAAVGNGGPGLSTAPSLADATSLVPVGGYISSRMWQELFGDQVAQDTAWLYSSSGPALRGVSPLLLAPAAAVSSVPLASQTSGYELYEGTSMAAPHAAGAAALLLQYARRDGLDQSGLRLARALAGGARRLDGVPAAQQGFGVLNVPGALSSLVSFGRKAPAPAVVIGAPDEEGIWARAYAAEFGADWALLVSNPGDTQAVVRLDSVAGTLAPERQIVVVPAGTERQIWVQPAPGSITARSDLGGLLVARDVGTNEPAGASVVVSPPVRTITPGTAGPVSLAVTAAPGASSRSYLEVPDGCSSLRIEASLTAAAGGGEFFLYSPAGYLVYRSGQLRVGSARQLAVASVSFPPAGTWEVIVAGDAGNGGDLGFGLACSTTGLAVQVTPSRVRHQGTAPARQQVNLTVDLPPGTANLYVEAYGWFGPGQGPEVSTHMGEIAGDGTQVWILPELDLDVGVAEFSLTSLNPGDADLFAYRLQGGPDGQWLPVGESTTVGRTAEHIMLWRPPAGEYAIAAEGQVDGQVYTVAAQVLRWPDGTMLLAEGSLPGSETAAATRTITFQLPTLAGASGTYRAIIVARAADSMVPLAMVPFQLEVANASVVPLLAPSVTRQAQQAGGNLPAPVVSIMAGDSLAALDARLVVGRRVTTPGSGALRLSANVLGVQPVAGQAYALVIESPGYLSWEGQLVMPTASRLPSGANEASGSSPFAWPEGTAGLRAALRRKANLAG